MKKKILIAVAVVVVLAGIIAALLYCDHQWADATCVTPSTCEKCGKTQGELLPHTWVDATCTEPETCSFCGLTQGNALGHDWLEANCTAPETCSRCDETQGDALGHDWLEATCSDPETCSRCGETQGETLEHDWLEATCTEPETCSLCSETQGEPLGHDWLEATCSEPETCAVCGETQGEVLEHEWLAATCAAPETCSLCGETRGDKTTDHNWRSATCTKPKTCSVCGKTTGDALGHEWRKATCTAPKTCTVCGKTSGSALGHTLEDGDKNTKICTVCGANVKLKYVAITFDDGPSGDITKTLLKGLKKRSVKATFFICGYRIKTYGSLPQTILDGGHEIGLHTDNHATLTKLSRDGIEEELTGVMSLLPEDYQVTLMRPPGGAYNSKVQDVCEDLGLSIIMWSVDPQDWATNNVSTITNRIVNNARDGSIILMHDLKSSSVQAALNAIDILQEQGYVFVTVSELAEIKGYDLEPGEDYYSLK